MGKKQDKKSKGKKQQPEVATLPSAEEIIAKGRAKVDQQNDRGDEPVKKMSRKEYEKELEPLQVELVRLQEWVKYTGARICVIFEGRDTAGKGGVIRAITERVSPRVFRVVALSTPTEREKSQMYFQRYMPHLPAGGEVVLFDRSWYNRAGVERVMGFAKPEQVEVFLKMTPPVERAIINSGIILVKYWLDVDMDEQAKRFQERYKDFKKIWKLSPMDLQAQARWYDYSRARDEMFECTDTPESPWYVINSNDQRRGRLNCISHLLSLIPYKDVPREEISFPERQEKGDYVAPNYPYRHVPEKY